MKRYSLAEIRHRDELADLSGEWLQLWRRCPAASPFQTPHWLLPWWDHFGGKGLRTLTVRREGRLTALAPMFEHAGRLSLLGTGVTDYPDILVDPQESMAPVAGHLREFEVDFWDVRPGSPLLAADGIRVESSSVSPVLTLPVAHRAGLRRQLARLRRQGEVRFDAATSLTFDEHLDALVRLHQERWTKREQRGALESRRMTGFLHAAGRALLRARFLGLHGLRLDGALIAALFALRSRGCSYFYLSGFDSRLAAFSPGALLIEAAIHHGARYGITEFDFLRGAEAYKYAWGARDRVNMRLRWSSMEQQAA